MLNAAFNKTNPIYPTTARPTTKNAKRTQFIARPRSQRAGIPRFCETNPICRGANMRNEPNLHRAGPVEDQKCETNPIYRTAGVSPASPHPAFMRNEPNLPPAHGHSEPGYPDYAKRSQFHHTKCPATPDFRETNPIPTRQKCETNPISTPSCLMPIASCLISAKRTQFTPSPPGPRQIMRNEPNPSCWPTPKYAKRTQFYPHSHPALRQKCETNPILTTQAVRLRRKSLLYKELGRKKGKRGEGGKGRRGISCFGRGGDFFGKSGCRSCWGVLYR